MSIPDWMTERNARWERERKERDAQLRAAGFRLIACVAYRNPHTGETRITTSMGALETIVITSLPDGHLQYGINCIVVGPESDVILDAPDPFEVARTSNGVVLTVFKGTRPQ